MLLSYLAGMDGMTKWTEGGVALPSRTDVPTPAGKDVLTKGSDYARPGSGFMPGYVDVQKAFQDAFTAQIQGKTYDAGPVVAATKAAIDKALAPVDAGGRRRTMARQPSGGITQRGGLRPRAARRRSEALAGYAFDRRADAAVPRPADRHGLLRGVHQPLAAGTSAPARSTSRGSPTTDAPLATRSSSARSRTRIYYAVIWVPLTMAIGLFLAIIVNQKIRGQTFFRGAYYFPAIASSAAITILWIFIVSPDGLFNSVRAVLAVRPARRRSSATARTRTGSVTRTRRSTRSSS